MDITVEGPNKSITITLTFADLMEYKEYRDRETANKKVWPEITILNPVAWYRVHKANLIKTTKIEKNLQSQ